MGEIQIVKGDKEMKKCGLLLTICLMFVCVTSTANGHMFWLNASNYSPKAGETVWLEIGFGHQFPRDELIKEGRVEQVYALGPSGKELNVQKIFPSFYQFTPPTEGAYQIIATMKPGFVSKTTDGRKLGSKKDHSNAVDCFAFRMTAKALISVGPSKGGPSKESKKPLEILALKNPVNLKVGQTLPLKVMFNGRPLAGAEVKAAHTGHTTHKKDQHAHTGHGKGMHQHWAQEAESNSEGIVQIILTFKGPWMFTTSHKTPYPDKNECDDYSYRTSLTLSFE